MSPPPLPVELWLDIFRWATLSSSTLSLSATKYKPFQASCASPADSVDWETVAVKRALVCVSKLWRELARDLLYEDVVIWRNLPSLQKPLHPGEVGEDKTRRVHRACLPYLSCTPETCEESAAIASLLESCPQLEVLSRPQAGRPGTDLLTFDFPAVDCPALQSLKRLDWWHYNEAARSGGYNSLTDVLRAAPNLEYLSIGGDLWLNLLQRGSLALPSLTTLRIRRMNILFMQQICRWSMPSLRNVVIDVFSTPRLLDPLWDHYGDQIKTMELGCDLKFYVMDIVSHVLGCCTTLEELGYFVMFTAAPQVPLHEHPTLSTLRWHIAPNGFFPTGGHEFWTHLAEHVDLFARPLFPALKRIVLHGDWSHVLIDERFVPLAKKLRERNIVLEKPF